MAGSSSNNIHATYIEILEDALKQLGPETPAEYAAISLKRSRPSDLADEGRYPEHYMKYQRLEQPFLPAYSPSCGDHGTFEMV